MSTYSDYLGLAKPTPAFPALVDAVSKIVIPVDFDKVIAARAAAGATALAASDLLEIAKAPANGVILATSVTVVKPTSAATSTVLPTCGSALTGAAVDATAAGTTAGVTNQPKILTADTAVTLTIGTAVPVGAVVLVNLLVANMN